MEHAVEKGTDLYSWFENDVEMYGAQTYCST